MSAPVPRERSLHLAQSSLAQAHNGQDQGDRDAYEDGAEEGSNGAVLEVFPNQSIDQLTSLTAARVHTDKRAGAQ